MISGCPIAFACFQRRVIHRRATVRVLSFDQVNLFEYFLSRNSLVKVGKSDKKVKGEKYKREKILAPDDCTILICFAIAVDSIYDHPSTLVARPVRLCLLGPTGQGCKG